MPLRGDWTLDDILTLSPDVPMYGGGQWAMYAIGCCWWTSFPEDLGVNTADLPCCPYCGSLLLQAPLEKFVATAREQPDHYGPGGLDNFVAAHSRNVTRPDKRTDRMTCMKRWPRPAVEGGEQ